MQMATSIESGDGEMIVKRVSVPIGLEELMEGLTKEVMMKKPKDIYAFAAEYFSHLLHLRDEGNFKGPSAKQATSMLKVSPRGSKQNGREIQKKLIAVKRIVPDVSRSSERTKEILDKRKKKHGSQEKKAGNLQRNRDNSSENKTRNRSSENRVEVAKQRDRSTSSSKSEESKKTPRQRAQSEKSDAAVRKRSTGETPRKIERSATVGKAARSARKPDRSASTAGKLDEKSSKKVPKSETNENEAGKTEIIEGGRGESASVTTKEDITVRGDEDQRENSEASRENQVGAASEEESGRKNSERSSQESALGDKSSLDRTSSVEKIKHSQNEEILSGENDTVGKVGKEEIAKGGKAEIAEVGGAEIAEAAKEEIASSKDKEASEKLVAEIKKSEETDSAEENVAGIDEVGGIKQDNSSNIAGVKIEESEQTGTNEENEARIGKVDGTKQEKIFSTVEAKIERSEETGIGGENETKVDGTKQEETSIAEAKIERSEKTGTSEENNAGIDEVDGTKQEETLVIAVEAKATQHEAELEETKEKMKPRVVVPIKPKSRTKIQNKTKSLPQELLDGSTNNMRRFKSVESMSSKHDKKASSVSSKDDKRDFTESTKNIKSTRIDKTDQRRSKRSTSVDGDRTTQPGKGRLENAEGKNSFDSAKLKKELKQVEDTSKLSNFKTSYNPYVLRQEIKKASEENEEKSLKVEGKKVTIGQLTAALRIQAGWRGFVARRNLKKGKIEETKMSSVDEARETNADEAKEARNDEEILNEERKSGKIDGNENLEKVGNADVRNVEETQVKIQIRKKKQDEAEDVSERISIGQIAAAVKIQSMWRGFVVRVNMKMKKEETGEAQIEVTDGSTLDKKAIDGTEREEAKGSKPQELKLKVERKKSDGKVSISDVTAALKIQSAWRGSVVRRRIKMQVKLDMEKNRAEMKKEKNEMGPASSTVGKRGIEEVPGNGEAKIERKKAEKASMEKAGAGTATEELLLTKKGTGSGEAKGSIEEKPQELRLKVERKKSDGKVSIGDVTAALRIQSAWRGSVVRRRIKMQVKLGNEEERTKMKRGKTEMEPTKSTVDKRGIEEAPANEEAKIETKNVEAANTKKVETGTAPEKLQETELEKRRTDANDGKLRETDMEAAQASRAELDEAKAEIVDTKREIAKVDKERIEETKLEEERAESAKLEGKKVAEAVEKEGENMKRSRRDAEKIDETASVEVESEEADLENDYRKVEQERAEAADAEPEGEAETEKEESNVGGSNAAKIGSAEARNEKPKVKKAKTEEAKVPSKAAEANVKRAKSEDAKLSKAKSGDAKLDKKKSEDVKLAKAKSGDAKLDKRKSEDDKLDKAKSGEAKLGKKESEDAKFEDAKLYKTKSEDAKLAKATSEDAKLVKRESEDAKLDAAKSGEAKFENAKLDKIKSEDAKLPKAKSEDAKLVKRESEDAKLDKAKSGEAKLDEAKSGQTKFEDAKLNQIKSEDAKLAKAKSKDAKLAKAKSGDAKLVKRKSEDAELDEAKSGEAKLDEAKSGQAKFEDAKLDKIKSEDAKLAEAKSEDAKLAKAKSGDAKLDRAKSRDAKLDKKESEDAELEYAKLDKTKSEDVKLTKAKSEDGKLAKAKSGDAKLDKAKSGDAKLDKIKSKDARLDKRGSEDAKLDESESEDPKLDEKKSEDTKLYKAKSGEAKLSKRESEDTNVNKAKSKNGKFDRTKSEDAKLDGSASEDAKEDEKYDTVETKGTNVKKGNADDAQMKIESKNPELKGVKAEIREAKLVEAGVKTKEKIDDEVITKAEKVEETKTRIGQMAKSEMQVVEKPAKTEEKTASETEYPEMAVREATGDKVEQEKVEESKVHKEHIPEMKTGREGNDKAEETTVEQPITLDRRETEKSGAKKTSLAKVPTELMGKNTEEKAVEEKAVDGRAFDEGRTKSKSKFSEAAAVLKIQSMWRGFVVRRAARSKGKKAVKEEKKTKTVEGEKKEEKNETKNEEKKKESLVEEKIEAVKEAKTKPVEEWKEAMRGEQKVVEKEEKKEEQGDNERQGNKGGEGKAVQQEKLGRSDGSTEAVKINPELDEPTKKKLTNAVVKIQTIWRGFNVRRLKKRGGFFGSAVERSSPLKEELVHVKKRHGSAALKIQSLWRGYTVRKNIKELDEKFGNEERRVPIPDGDVMKAAAKIQAGVRGYMVRKKMGKNTLNSISEEPDEDILKALGRLEAVPEGSPEPQKAENIKYNSIDEGSVTEMNDAIGDSAGPMPINGDRHYGAEKPALEMEIKQAIAEYAKNNNTEEIPNKNLSSIISQQSTADASQSQELTANKLEGLNDGNINKDKISSGEAHETDKLQLLTEQKQISDGDEEPRRPLSLESTTSQDSVNTVIYVGDQDAKSVQSERFHEEFVAGPGEELLNDYDILNLEGDEEKMKVGSAKKNFETGEVESKNSSGIDKLTGEIAKTASVKLDDEDASKEDNEKVTAKDCSSGLEETIRMIEAEVHDSSKLKETETKATKDASRETELIKDFSDGAKRTAELIIKGSSKQTRLESTGGSSKEPRIEDASNEAKKVGQRIRLRDYSKDYDETDNTKIKAESVSVDRKRETEEASGEVEKAGRRIRLKDYSEDSTENTEPVEKVTGISEVAKKTEDSGKAEIQGPSNLIVETKKENKVAPKIKQGRRNSAVVDLIKEVEKTVLGTALGYSEDSDETDKAKIDTDSVSVDKKRKAEEAPSGVEKVGQRIRLKDYSEDSTENTEPVTQITGISETTEKTEESEKAKAQSPASGIVETKTENKMASKDEENQNKKIVDLARKVGKAAVGIAADSLGRIEDVEKIERGSESSSRRTKGGKEETKSMEGHLNVRGTSEVVDRLREVKQNTFDLGQLRREVDEASKVGRNSAQHDKTDASETVDKTVGFSTASEGEEVKHLGRAESGEARDSTKVKDENSKDSTKSGNKKTVNLNRSEEILVDLESEDGKVGNLNGSQDGTLTKVKERTSSIKSGDGTKDSVLEDRIAAESMEDLEIGNEKLEIAVSGDSKLEELSKSEDRSEKDSSKPGDSENSGNSGSEGIEGTKKTSENAKIKGSVESGKKKLKESVEVKQDEAKQDKAQDPSKSGEETLKDLIRSEEGAEMEDPAKAEVKGLTKAKVEDSTETKIEDSTKTNVEDSTTTELRNAEDLTKSEMKKLEDSNYGDKAPKKSIESESKLVEDSAKAVGEKDKDSTEYSDKKLGDLTKSDDLKMGNAEYFGDETLDTSPKSVGEKLESLSESEDSKKENSTKSENKKEVSAKFEDKLKDSIEFEDEKGEGVKNVEKKDLEIPVELDSKELESAESESKEDSTQSDARKPGHSIKPGEIEEKDLDKTKNIKVGHSTESEDEKNKNTKESETETIEQKSDKSTKLERKDSKLVINGKAMLKENEGRSKTITKPTIRSGQKQAEKTEIKRRRSREALKEESTKADKVFNKSKSVSADTYQKDSKFGKIRGSFDSPRTTENILKKPESGRRKELIKRKSLDQLLNEENKAKKDALVAARSKSGREMTKLTRKPSFNSAKEENAAGKAKVEKMKKTEAAKAEAGEKLSDSIAKDKKAFDLAKLRQEIKSVSSERSPRASTERKDEGEETGVDDAANNPLDNEDVDKEIDMGAIKRIEELKKEDKFEADVTQVQDRLKEDIAGDKTEEEELIKFKEESEEIFEDMGKTADLKTLSKDVKELPDTSFDEDKEIAAKLLGKLPSSYDKLDKKALDNEISRWNEELKDMKEKGELKDLKVALEGEAVENPPDAALKLIHNEENNKLDRQKLKEELQNNSVKRSIEDTVRNVEEPGKEGGQAEEIKGGETEEIKILDKDESTKPEGSRSRVSSSKIPKPIKKQSSFDSDKLRKEIEEAENIAKDNIEKKSDIGDEESEDSGNTAKVEEEMSEAKQELGKDLVEDGDKTKKIDGQREETFETNKGDGDKVTVEGKEQSNDRSLGDDTFEDKKPSRKNSGSKEKIQAQSKKLKAASEGESKVQNGNEDRGQEAGNKIRDEAENNVQNEETKQKEQNKEQNKEAEVQSMNKNEEGQEERMDDRLNRDAIKLEEQIKLELKPDEEIAEDGEYYVDDFEPPESPPRALSDIREEESENHSVDSEMESKKEELPKPSKSSSLDQMGDSNQEVKSRSKRAISVDSAAKESSFDLNKLRRELEEANRNKAEAKTDKVEVKIQPAVNEGEEMEEPTRSGSEVPELKKDVKKLTKSSTVAIVDGLIDGEARVQVRRAVDSASKQTSFDLGKLRQELDEATQAEEYKANNKDNLIGEITELDSEAIIKERTEERSDSEKAGMKYDGEAELKENKEAQTIQRVIEEKDANGVKADLKESELKKESSQKSIRRMSIAGEIDTETIKHESKEKAVAGIGIKEAGVGMEKAQGNKSRDEVEKSKGNFQGTEDVTRINGIDDGLGEPQLKKENLKPTRRMSIVGGIEKVEDEETKKRNKAEMKLDEAIDKTKEVDTDKAKNEHTNKASKEDTDKSKENTDEAKEDTNKVGEKGIDNTNEDSYKENENINKTKEEEEEAKKLEERDVKNQGVENEDVHESVESISVVESNHQGTAGNGRAVTTDYASKQNGSSLAKLRQEVDEATEERTAEAKIGNLHKTVDSSEKTGDGEKFVHLSGAELEEKVEGTTENGSKMEEIQTGVDKVEEKAKEEAAVLEDEAESGETGVKIAAGNEATVEALPTKAANKEATSKEASSKEATSKEATSKEATSKEASNKQASNKAAINQRAADEEATHKQQETTNKEARVEEIRKSGKANLRSISVEPRKAAKQPEPTTGSFDLSKLRRELGEAGAEAEEKETAGNKNGLKENGRETVRKAKATATTQQHSADSSARPKRNTFDLAQLRRELLAEMSEDEEEKKIEAEKVDAEEQVKAGEERIESEEEVFEVKKKDSSQPRTSPIQGQVLSTTTINLVHTGEFHDTPLPMTSSPVPQQPPSERLRQVDPTRDGTSPISVQMSQDSPAGAPVLTSPLGTPSKSIISGGDRQDDDDVKRTTTTTTGRDGAQASDGSSAAARGAPS